MLTRRDDRWSYAKILWNGIRAKSIQTAFAGKRNAICVRCGRVSPMSSRSFFEKLATLFEDSGNPTTCGMGFDVQSMVWTFCHSAGTIHSKGFVIQRDAAAD